MISIKFKLNREDKLLADEINALDRDKIKSVISKGLFGSEEITIAIIAAAPGLIAQIASVIKNYIVRNNSKSFTLKIDDKEMSFTGYSVDEIDEILLKYGKHNSNENR